MSKITIEFTPKDGSLSAVGTELTGADVIQRDLEKLASKFDGGIDWGDISVGAWDRVDDEIEAARTSAISTAKNYVVEEKAERVSADATTLASAKEFATSADASVLSAAKQYATEQVSTEATNRVSADENTLTSAKTFATDADKTVLNSATEYTDTEINAEVTARNTAITNATSNLATKSSVADAISNSHTHSNKSVIDTITQTKIDKWDSGGTTDYAELTNKPTINGVVLGGDKTLNDLGDGVLVLTKAITTQADVFAFRSTTTVIYDSPTAVSIGMDAFTAYTALQEVHLCHVTELQIGAFRCGGTLENKYGARILDIPSVKTLGDGACQDNTSLELVIMRDIETIGGEAFDCTNANNRRIFDMTQVASPPTIATNSITKTDGLRIVVPKNDINTWKTAEGWSNYADYIFTSPYPR